MSGNDGERLLARALPDQVVPPLGIDDRVEPQGAQAASLAQVQVRAGDLDVSLESAPVAHHHPIDGRDRERSVGAGLGRRTGRARSGQLVRDAHVIAGEARIRPRVTAIREDVLVE